MNSFRKTEKELQLPLGVVWLMNSIAEYKGKEELYIRQSIISWANFQYPT